MVSFFVWSGRMNRRQYFVNWLAIIGVLFGFAMFMNAVYSKFEFIVLLLYPFVIAAGSRFMAITARRFHDCGESAFWVWLLVLFWCGGVGVACGVTIPFCIAMTCWRGQETANEYGPVPGKENEVEEASAQGFFTEEYAQNLGMQKIEGNNTVYYVDVQNFRVHRNLGDVSSVSFMAYEFVTDEVCRYNLMATVSGTGTQSLREISTETLDTNGKIISLSGRTDITYDLQNNEVARALFDCAVKMLKGEKITENG